jgi:membrane fusion protein (multidrug efflux system)
MTGLLSPAHLLMLFLACLAIAALPNINTILLAQQPGMEGVGAPPAVVVETIQVEEVSDPAKFTARVEAIEAVDIRARVPGFLRSVKFEDGQTLKAGDLLFEIEPDMLEATVASAQAQVARAEATRLSTERSLERSRDLYGRKTIARATLDDAQAAFDIAVADVDAAKAALNIAKLNLSYARIATPISGNIGRPAFTVGNLVGTESGALARIVSLDPIRVAFPITENLLVTLRQEEAQNGVMDTSSFRLSLRLANGTDYSESGRIEFIENEVNAQTGTVTARAIFANPHHILLPGQFVTLLVQDGETPSLPVVPQTAVLQDREGRFVYLLDDGNTVSQRRIETGARVESGWAVTEGLSGGEKVVVKGIQRIADGMTVQPSDGLLVGGSS